MLIHVPGYQFPRRPLLGIWVNRDNLPLIEGYLACPKNVPFCYMAAGCGLARRRIPIVRRALPFGISRETGAATYLLTNQPLTAAVTAVAPVGNGHDDGESL